MAYLTVAEVAELLRCSTRTVHELTRTRQIPHRRIGGTRRCLFLPDELGAWLDGADLETADAPNGGHVVRVKQPTAPRTVA